MKRLEENLIILCIIITLLFLLSFVGNVLFVNYIQEIKANNLEICDKLITQEERTVVLEMDLQEAQKQIEMYELELEAYKSEAFVMEPIVTEKELDMIAQTMLGEAGGLSEYHHSMVVWCILNRVDAGDAWGHRVAGVIAAPNQFHGYVPTYPVLPELRELAEDIVIRWQLEKKYGWDVGRTLPSDIMFFHAKNGYNAFYKMNNGSREYYDWHNQYNPYAPTRE